jgi:hypothetical protein
LRWLECGICAWFGGIAHKWRIFAMFQLIHPLLGFSFLFFLNEILYRVENQIPFPAFALYDKSPLVALPFDTRPFCKH